MEGLRQCEANLIVQIHPSKSNSVLDALLGELSSLLFSYNESFQGVVLAYDPNNLSPLAKILPGIHPYLGVTLQARLLLFDPKPGMFIEGEVVKVTRNSLHVVVLGFCSCLISAEDVRDEFKFKTKGNGKEEEEEQGFFVSRVSRKHRIGVGSFVRFLVKGFETEVLHFSGEMVGKGTGCVKWLERNVGKWDGAESSQFGNKRKVKDEVTNGDDVAGNKSKSNKKKKRKVKEEVH